MGSISEAKPRRTQPALEEIRARAYEIYLARAGRPGSPESDWAQAERELTAAMLPAQPDAPLAESPLPKRAARTSAGAPESAAGGDGVATRTARRSRTKSDR